MMDFYLKTNLKQAILLGKALLSDDEITEIPPIIQKEIIFNLGTAYLLSGNLKDAKARYRELLLQEPNYRLRGMALNNLALCYWWQKIPCYEDLDRFETGEEDEVVDKEFGLVVPMMKKSLKALEKVGETSEREYSHRLEVLLDEESLGPGDERELKDAEGLFLATESLKVVNNLAEFILRYRGDHKDVR